MARCILACLKEFLSNLGWFALLGLLTCVIGGGILAVLGGAAAGAVSFGTGAVAVGAAAVPIIAGCVGLAVGGAAIAGIATCIASCK